LISTLEAVDNSGFELLSGQEVMNTRSGNEEHGVHLQEDKLV